MSPHQLNNMNRTRIPKSWILLAVFIVSVIGAGAWIFTIPPNGITNQTGSFFGNTSNDANNYTADNFILNSGGGINQDVRTVASPVFVNLSLWNLTARQLVISDNINSNNPGFLGSPNRYYGSYMTYNGTFPSFFSGSGVRIDDFSPNNGDHIAQTLRAYAHANRNITGNGTGGDIWGQFVVINNLGFNSSGIGVEINPSNEKAEFPDTGQPPFMYGIHMYPDDAFYNITRGISLVNNGSIGYLTGVYISGYVNNGIKIVKSSVSSDTAIDAGKGSINNVNNIAATNVLVGDSNSTIKAPYDGADNTIFQIDPVPKDGTKVSQIRFFRNVNTGGARNIVIYKGDGTSTSTVTIDAGSGSITSGFVGSNTTTLTTALNVGGNITMIPQASNKPSCITMKSPDGTSYRFTIANGGTVAITAGACDV